MKTPLNFTYSDRFGVGFLIVHGGIPQFTIAWDGDHDPRRMTLAEAENVQLCIDGIPITSYEFHESWNSCEMKLKEAPVEASESESESESDDESQSAES